MIWLLVAYTVFIVVVFIWMGIIGAQFEGTLTPATLPENPPSVSTVVPARNEERNIGRCAQGLIRQDYPKLEMIFVDDDSADATPDILATFSDDRRVKVIGTGGKPNDWNGKQWACHSGYLETGGEWLCFMDADTCAEPDLIRRTMAFALENKVDMLTVQPWFEMHSLWERIVLPTLLAPLLFMYPARKVNDPNDKMAIANGQFILIRREVYEAVGGHEAVKQRMMDDFPLAENVKGAGYRLFMADGREVIRVRLYTNLKEIRHSMIKASVDATGGWFKTLLGFFGYTFIMVLPTVLLIVGLLVGNKEMAWLMGGLAAFQILYSAVLRMVAFKAPPWSGISFALGSLVTALIMLEGMIRVATGLSIQWRGRNVMR